jgi:photosystem II stability/assembly factor-like uncharacterized protein
MKKINILPLQIMFALIFSNSFLFADNFWGVIPSPERSDVRVIGVDSNDNVYACIWGGGVQKSTDFGNSWGDITNNLGNLNITTIEFAPNGNIFVGTLGGGVYRSINGGTDWVEVNTGLHNRYVKAMTITSDGKIFVGTRGGGVFRSLDNGTSWTQHVDGMYYRDITALIYADDTTIIAGTSGKGIYRSIKSGQEWSQSGLAGKYITSFFKNHIGEIMCGTWGSGAYLSVNKGTSWNDFLLTKMPKNITACVMPPAADPVVGTSEFGIMRWDDVYDEWKRVASPLTDGGIYDLAITKNGTLFTSMAIEGVFKSTNFGRNWALVGFNVNIDMNFGLINVTAYKNGVVLASRNTGGIYISYDNGYTWNYRNIGSVIYTFAFDSSGNIYAGGSGIYRSTDGGSSWEAWGLANQPVISIACKSNGYIFAGVIPNVQPGNPPQPVAAVYRTNNGAWEVVANSINRILYIGINKNGDIYAPIDGVNRSTNNGDSWTQVLKDKVTRSIAFTKNGTIFLGTSDSLYSSSNNGATWQKDNLNQQYPYAIKVVVSNQDNLFVLGNQYNWILMKAYGSNKWDTVNTGFYQQALQSMTASFDGFVYIATTAIYRYAEPLNLGVPNLVLPPYDSGNQPLKPAFDWDEASRAEMYQFQISELLDFSSTIEDVTLDSTNWQMVRELNYNQQYLWRVRSKVNNSLGEWSRMFVFYTKLDAPILKLPKNNKGNISDSVDLVWRKVAGAVSYHLQVSLDPNFNSIFYENLLITDTTTRITGLQIDTRYYWKVKAKNTKSQSDWSEIWSFSTKLKAPKLRLPPNGAYGLPTSVTMEWDTANNATGYVIQISRSSDFSDFSKMIFNGATQTNRTHQITILEKFTTYYWRIMATNEDGNSEWSETWHYTTIMNAPVLIQPVKGALDVKLKTVFQWQKFQPATSYHLQISKSPTLANPFYDDSLLTVDSIEISTFDDYSTYYWRVQIKVNDWLSPWSEVWHFKTGLAKPILDRPLDKSINIPVSAYLFWKEVRGATSYQLQVATDPDFKTIFKDESNITALQAPVNAMQFLTTHYWRVKAFYNDGESEFSDIWSFVTADSITSVLDDHYASDIKAFPNPFENLLNISYYLDKDCSVRIILTDAIGKTNIIILDEIQSQGFHSFSWKESGISQGVYFLRLYMGHSLYSKEVHFIK